MPTSDLQKGYSEKNTKKYIFTLDEKFTNKLESLKREILQLVICQWNRQEKKKKKSNRRQGMEAEKHKVCWERNDHSILIGPRDLTALS